MFRLRLVKSDYDVGGKIRIDVAENGVNVPSENFRCSHVRYRDEFWEVTIG